MAGIEITTNIQLNTVMNNILEQVFDEVSDIISKTFKENYIQKMVYDSHGPNTVYENPLGQEFKEAWVWGQIKISAREVSKEMFYDWKNMDSVPDKWGSTGIHGSTVPGWSSDERSFLAEVLNKSGPSSSLWLSVSRTQAYWTTFIQDYVDGGKLKQLFDKTFSKYGIRAG